MEDIIAIEMSELDYRLIMHIKSMRESKNISQVALSHKMGLSSGFIGKVELLTAPDKYSIRHLKLLADIFKVKSFSDLLPIIPENDKIRLTLKVSAQIKKDGSPSKKKFTEVIKIEPLN